MLVFGRCVPNSATRQHVPAAWFPRWVRPGPNDIDRGHTASAARVRSLFWINQTAFEMKATKYWHTTSQLGFSFLCIALFAMASDIALGLAWVLGLHIRESI